MNVSEQLSAQLMDRWDPLDNPTAASARAEGASPGRRIKCHAVWRHLLVGLGNWGQYVSGFGVGTSWSTFAYDMWDPAASPRGSRRTYGKSIFALDSIQI